MLLAPFLLCILLSLFLNVHWGWSLFADAKFKIAARNHWNLRNQWVAKYKNTWQFSSTRVYLLHAHLTKSKNTWSGYNYTVFFVKIWIKLFSKRWFGITVSILASFTQIFNWIIEVSCDVPFNKMRVETTFYRLSEMATKSNCCDWQMYKDFWVTEVKQAHK